MDGHSIVQYFGPGRGHSCGYCKSSHGNFSYGMWAYQMTPEDYQNLIDRGWRRSGQYLYRPQLDIQCCPMYTLKCHASSFKPSKSHKRVIKTFNRYINYGTVPKRYRTEDGKMATNKDGLDDEDDDDDDDDVAKDGGNDGDEVAKAADEDASDNDGDAIAKAADDNDDKDEITTSKVEEGSDNTTDKQHKKPKNPKPGLGADLEKPPARKAKLMRMMRKKMKKGGDEVQASKKQAKKHEKSLEELLNDFVENPVHKLEISLIPCTESNLDHLLETSHHVYHHYQTTIHHDPPSKPSTSQYKRFLLNSPISNNNTHPQQLPLLFLVNNTNTNNDKNLKNKNNNHNNEKTHFSDPSSSLSTSSSSTPPLLPSTSRHQSAQPLQDSPQTPKGSFHQQYYIDGQLVCVAVLDILTTCISSVYLFYHPQYSFLSLGTYTALRELAYTRQLQRQDNKISAYYMGFYIHSCPKMKYKGQFQPSFLLCPESFTWQPIGRSLQLIDKNKYSRLSHIDQIDPGIVDMNINEVKILHKGRSQKYSQYKKGAGSRGTEDSIIEYANLVGKKCAYDMLLFQK